MSGRVRLHDSARGVIDYALARRAALSGLASGRLRKTEVCDAQPYLLRAARFHGERSADQAPACRTDSRQTAPYAGVAFFRSVSAGRARATREIAEPGAQLPDFSVCVVHGRRTCTAWDL